MNAEKIHKILGVDDIFKAPARLMEILLSGKEVREPIFTQLLELFKFKLDVDFWHGYFQDEAAERKKQKQDFTPMSVAGLVSKLVGGSDIYYEPTAGTGGMMIANWHENRIKHPPLKYKPSNYLYVCEEMSDRAFPFLIFNMAIRGMNGAAVHCDSLTRECCGVFFIQNDKDDPVSFSSVNVMPYNEKTEKHFNVKFGEQKYKHYIESPLLVG
ncbi:MAG: N-6 DNA methylase [Defluviitaleaceae bacterium]|nr:N-6 DNA methylase [Defluviitaleaceae bacterium]MCL2261659.1 N-6 DNA methylase [Defluviitaleaceae bacterium]